MRPRALRCTATHLVALAIVSCGDGTAPSLPPPVPPPGPVETAVASVVIIGATRVKVGDPYQYSATLYDARGAVVVRPMTWRVLEFFRAAMTSDGVMVPIATGNILVIVTVDGEDWAALVTSYDWERLDSGGSLRWGLSADSMIVNRFGQTEFPLLIVTCSNTGQLLVSVSFDRFLAASGAVIYYIGGDGPLRTSVWGEVATLNALFHPGPTNLQVRAFILQIATADRFGFTFYELNGMAKSMVFRLSGLEERLAPLNAACPSNSPLMAAAIQNHGPVAAPLGVSGSSDVARKADRPAQTHAIRLTAVPIVRLPSTAAPDRTQAVRLVR